MPSSVLLNAPSPSVTGGKRAVPPHSFESPAKKQSKWSQEEDEVIIGLRASGMKWDDISKRLPGRSAISCRLHYQNYLERRSEWDEERKNKLARLYERFKAEMWAKVADEMHVPWRAAEAMHWQLGEAEMARRAGVVPFSLSGLTPDAPSGPRQSDSPSRSLGHAYSQSHSGSAPSPLGGPVSGHRPRSSVNMNMGVPYPQNVNVQRATSTRSIAARRESMPRSVPASSPAEGLVLAGIRGPFGMERGGSGGQMLPSVTEMVTRVSPYSTPAYSGGGSMSGYPSPGPLLPPMYRENSGQGGRPPSVAEEGEATRSPDGGREGMRRSLGGPIGRYSQA